MTLPSTIPHSCHKGRKNLRDRVLIQLRKNLGLTIEQFSWVLCQLPLSHTWRASLGSHSLEESWIKWGCKIRMVTLVSITSMQILPVTDFASSDLPCLYGKHICCGAMSARGALEMPFLHAQGNYIQALQGHFISYLTKSLLIFSLCSHIGTKKLLLSISRCRKSSKSCLINLVTF